MSGVNDRIDTAIKAVWDLEGILTEAEMLKIVTQLRAHKDQVY